MTKLSLEACRQYCCYPLLIWSTGIYDSFFTIGKREKSRTRTRVDKHTCVFYLFTTPKRNKPTHTYCLVTLLSKKSQITVLLTSFLLWCSTVTQRHSQSYTEKMGVPQHPQQRRCRHDVFDCIHFFESHLLKTVCSLILSFIHMARNNLSANR